MASHRLDDVSLGEWLASIIPLAQCRRIFYSIGGNISNAQYPFATPPQHPTGPRSAASHDRPDGSPSPWQEKNIQLTPVLQVHWIGKTI